MFGCLFANFMMISLLGCSSANIDDTGSVPRQIVLSEDDLGDLRTITGETASGVYVTMSTRQYSGLEVGHWGSETSPPFDVLWEFSFDFGEGVVRVPDAYLRDLAHIVLSPLTRTIESYIAMNPERLTVTRQGDRYLIHLDAGDGANAYSVDFDVVVDEVGSIDVNRTVRYHMDGSGEIWAP